MSIPDQKYLVIGGLVVKPRTGFLFRITEVQQAMTNEEMRVVGKPTWPHRADE